MSGAERASGEWERTVAQEERRGRVTGPWGSCEAWVDPSGARTHWRRFSRGSKDVALTLMTTVTQDRLLGKEGSRKQANSMASTRVRCVLWTGRGLCEAEHEWDGEAPTERRAGRRSPHELRVRGGGGHGSPPGSGDALMSPLHARAQRSPRPTTQPDMGREPEADGDWAADRAPCATSVQLEKISCFSFTPEPVGGLTSDMYVYRGCASQTSQAVCN